ncbi:hypothetical protein [Flavobacterium pedocola]
MKKVLIVCFLAVFFNANSQISTATGGAGNVLPNNPTSNTNVGIGTDNPLEKLDVRGSVRGEKGIFDGALPNGTPRVNNDDFVVLAAGSKIGSGIGYEKTRMLNFFDFPSPTAGTNTGSIAYFGIEDRNDFGRYRMVAHTGGSTMMYLMNKTQQEFFKVNDDGSDNIYMQMGKPNSRFIIGGYADYVPGLSHKLVVQNGSALIEGNVITNSNIGIGTSSFVDGNDTYRLSVDGAVRAERVRVYTSWADFVFEPQYKLPTLKEVEAHIKEKGHLKDIPSAAEVEKNGIDLGEMNKRLLQKVEELTLYMIKMNEEIESLKKQVNEK